MTESRTDKMEEIRARLERDDYVVDAGKVADAIIARLLAGRSAKDAAR
jgi:anti-sigma28 factor (negative regulator of flagellin synthesis)